MAGTGKSTIGRTICRTLYKEGLLGASFFFSINEGDDVSRMRLFYTTIASQLAKAGPDDLKHHICTAAHKHTDMLDKGRHIQWRSLIIDPLKMMRRSAEIVTRVIVIDALDECEDEKDISGFVHLLREVEEVVNIKLRIIIFSRPGPPVSDGITGIPGPLLRQLSLDEEQQKTIDKDIRLYLIHQFQNIKQQKIVDLDSWPRTRDISRLVRLSSGLFIYAATACTFIFEDIDRTAEESLIWFLQEMEAMEKQAGRPAGTAEDRDHTSPLDRMYVRILQNALRDGTTEARQDRLAEHLRNLLGAVIILQEPVTPKTLQNLRRTPSENIRFRLRRLQSVIRVPADDLSTLRLSHMAFRDFLLDCGRCSDRRFVVNLSQANNGLLQNCFTVMNSTLRQDICNLCHPGALNSRITKSSVEVSLPLHAQYACKHWVAHYRYSDESDASTQVFLKSHLLHWLEAMSLIGQVQKVTLVMADLCNVVQVCLCSKM
jgi:hypothetical protein